VSVANFPKELLGRAWAEASLNVKQWSVFQTGFYSSLPPTACGHPKVAQHTSD
jgi:hypothetical protein